MERLYQKYPILTSFCVLLKWLNKEDREKICFKVPIYFCRFWGVIVITFVSKIKIDRVRDYKKSNLKKIIVRKVLIGFEQNRF